MTAGCLLRFELRNWWHAGTGKGVRGHVDASPVRSPEGLPYLPGRTVRGLVREALTLTSSLQPELVPAQAPFWFCGRGMGDDDRVAPGRSRYLTEPGHARFHDATMPREWRRWSARQPEMIEHMYEVLSATAIAESGLARGQTLRSIEVAPPLELWARVRIEEPPDWSWRQALEWSVPLIRGLGSGRNRGLGRVVVSVHDLDEGGGT
ncbi:MAG: hypothetical protein HQL41_07015 [Alphaproteobacteria bacterium]|nr:hypothetical protein [Alphaproteobacteria bacterium]